MRELRMNRAEVKLILDLLDDKVQNLEVQEAFGRLTRSEKAALRNARLLLQKVVNMPHVKVTAAQAVDILYAQSQERIRRKRKGRAR